MHPYLLRIGDLSIAAYPVLYGLGIATAGLVAIILGVRQGLPRARLADLVLLIALAIVCGGRAFYVAQHWGDFRNNAIAAFDLSDGGQVFYGGLLLALAVFWGYCKLTRLPLTIVGDALAVGIPLGHAIGRVGCFCRGCCYGRVSDAAWAIRFPKFIDAEGHTIGSPPFVAHLDRGLIHDWARESLPVHPAQLYASAVLVLLFAAMLFVWHKGWLRGQLLPSYILVYACARFVLEAFRDNEMAFWGLTIAQVVSVGVVIAAVTWMVTIRHFRTAPPSPEH